jgi:hypothetical protein
MSSNAEICRKLAYWVLTDPLSKPEDS